MQPYRYIFSCFYSLFIEMLGRKAVLSRFPTRVLHAIAARPQANYSRVLLQVHASIDANHECASRVQLQQRIFQLTSDQ